MTNQFKNISRIIFTGTIVVVTLLYITSCEKEKSGNGKITFYSTQDFNCGKITVEVQGYGSKTITSYYMVTQSECDRDDAANFTLPPGNYTYSAYCQGRSWGPANFKINAGECTPFKLQ